MGASWDRTVDDVDPDAPAYRLPTLDSALKVFDAIGRRKFRFQHKFADAVPVDRTVMSRWFLGKSKPSGWSVWALADALGYDILLVRRDERVSKRVAGRG
jgi:hypothetical protein